MAPRKFLKYARSTSPSRLQQNDDPPPGKESSDFNLLIGALTSRVLDKGLMDNKFQKIFFFSRDEQRKTKEEQRIIVEKKLTFCLRFPNKIQNQATIRLVEEFAKENGFTIENSIKYQQYEILGKPIIFQPTVHVTKDNNWFDIFEQFKSENLKIVPNQNLQEFNNLINNQQLSTWEKLSHILKQRFMIHNANEFPSINPIIGNEDEDGNLQFLIDENLIPHRIIFRNKDEYELMNWYVENKNKNDLNIVTQDWNAYINNVQKLRDKQPDKQERKIIQIKNQMQVEQEAIQQKQPQRIQQKQSIVNQIDNQQDLSFVQFQQKNIRLNQSKKDAKLSNQSIHQSFIQEQKPQIKIKNIQENSQLQQQILQNEQIDRLLNDEQLVQINKMNLDELADQVLQNLGIIQDNNQMDTPQKSGDKMLITVQLPIEIKKKQQIKLLQTNFKQELDQGFIYLNEQELINLDQEIQEVLKQIGFSIKKIKINDQEYTLNSPFCVKTNLILLNFARQWHFFRNYQHAQISWLFQQYLMDTNLKQQVSEYLQSVQQAYIDKWLNFINTDQSIWSRTTEESLTQSAQNLSGDIIYKSDDKNACNYTLKIIEDVWYTFSCIKQIILINTVYDVKQTIMTFLNIKGEFFVPNLNIKNLLIGMKGYGLGIQYSPIFEPTVTHEIVCWLCCSLHESWEQFYIHKCNNSQAKPSFKQDHLQAWKLFKSK